MKILTPSHGSHFGSLHIDTLCITKHASEVWRGGTFESNRALTFYNQADNRKKIA